MRHGPHHSAQKSTRTGSGEPKTSWSKAASVKTNVLSPAIFISKYFDVVGSPTIHGSGTAAPCLSRLRSRLYNRAYSRADTSQEKYLLIARRIRASHFSGRRNSATAARMASSNAAPEYS